MLRLEMARGAFADCFRCGRLWLIQFFANPILLALFAAWLLIPVASNLHLVFNFLFVFVLLVAALTLHACTLNFFVDRQSSDTAPLWPAARRALRHLIPVAICVAVFCLLWLLVNKIRSLPLEFPRVCSFDFSRFSSPPRHFARSRQFVPGCCLLRSLDSRSWLALTSPPASCRPRFSWLRQTEPLCLEKNCLEHCLLACAFVRGSPRSCRNRKTHGLDAELQDLDLAFRGLQSRPPSFRLIPFRIIFLDDDLLTAGALRRCCWNAL